MVRSSTGNAASQRASREGRSIAIIGSGYVGLASAICLAELGHRVVGVDLDREKVSGLQKAISPIYEAGIDEYVSRHRATGRLSFTTSYAEALRGAEFVFLCVGTPPAHDGSPDLSQVRAAVTSIGRHLPPGRRVIVVNKSTLPVGSAGEVRDLLAINAMAEAEFSVVSNPEFLREGHAVYDVLHPDRIVIGADDDRAATEVAALYDGLECPVVITDSRSAELIKYASNAFLATKISFANQLAELCERVGADVRVVSSGMGMDPRIGPGHLAAGLGYGGSCLPKDVEGLIFMGAAAGLEMPLLHAVQEINLRQRRRLVERLDHLLGGLQGRCVAIWGLAFKEGTDDLRDAPAIAIIEMLRDAGIGQIRAYDPQAMGRAMPVVGDVTLCPDPYEAVRDSDALVVVTAWPEFAGADLKQVATLMRGRILMDGRSAIPAAAAREAGLEHHVMGIGAVDGRSGDAQLPADFAGAEGP